MKNEQFTKEYLDKIIVAKDQHSIDEWLEAFKKLNSILYNPEFDVRNLGFSSLKQNFEHEDMMKRELVCMDYCLEVVLQKSLDIVDCQAYDTTTSELVRSAWWELISFFDYAPELYVNVYGISMIKNAAMTLEKSVSILAEKIKD